MHLYVVSMRFTKQCALRYMYLSSGRNCMPERDRERERVGRREGGSEGRREGGIGEDDAMHDVKYVHVHVLYTHIYLEKH